MRHVQGFFNTIMKKAKSGNLSETNHFVFIQNGVHVMSVGMAKHGFNIHSELDATQPVKQFLSWLVE